MNADTGKTYRTDEAKSEAMDRGENLTEVSERVADFIERGRAAQLAALRHLRTHRGITNTRRPPHNHQRRG